MTAAICFKCGSEKPGALAVCWRCGVTPRTEDELSLSLVLCEHLASKAQLTQFAHEIRNGIRLAVPDSLLAQAREALKDSQLMAMLGERHEVEKVSKTTIHTVQKEPVNRHARRQKVTALHRNAFFILGATIRDDRRKIVGLAEDKSLEIDHETCQKARSDLTNPRTRLVVEMAWLPGVSPKKATLLIDQVLQNPMSIRMESGLPLLAHANLMAAVFEAGDDTNNPEDIADFIQEMALLVDDLSIADIMRDLNEDRLVAGFPEINIEGLIEAELTERKRYFKNAIKEALNRLPPQSLVEVITLVVNDVTAGGEDLAPGLIDELVDSYEAERQGVLEKEAENIETLIEATRNAAQSGENAAKQLIDKLDVAVRNWDKIAQPIQLSAKARGTEHELSKNMAHSIRGMAIDLFNKHDMLAQSNRLTSLLQEVFAELPEVAERVEEDANVLQGIFNSRKKAETEWAQEITYRIELGLIFKDTLSISPDGVSWNKQKYALNAITRVRWGGGRTTVNGIPSETYIVAFGDNRSEAVITLSQNNVYSTFVNKLWHAVGGRLVTNMLEALRAGQEFRFGEAVFKDDGITLIKRKFWTSSEPVRCLWHQVRFFSSNGEFRIALQGDDKTYVALSYIHTMNTHILEHALQMASRTPGIHKLSDVLNKS